MKYSEQDLIKAYLTNGIDDILSKVTEEEQKKMASFLANLTAGLVHTSQKLDSIFVRTIEKLPDKFTKKQFISKIENLDKKYKPLLISMLPGSPTLEILIPVLTKACDSVMALEEYRWLIGGIKFKDKIKEEVINV